MRNKLKMEYIWLDGYKPEANLRSKTKLIKVEDFDGTVECLPNWSFDGSSTRQAEGWASDCILKPVRIYVDPHREDAYLVICEVNNPDGTPHSTNSRAKIKSDSDEIWFGYEQEYVLMKVGKPLGFPKEGYPGPQGPYYCAVGHGNVDGRQIIEDHLDACIDAGIDIEGINAEVLLGQWEFQIFGKSAKRAADDLIAARYLLFRITEEYEVTVDLHPKPVRGDWNGSGMHVNFSNERMRKKGGKAYFDGIFKAFEKSHKEHIAVYGSDNHLRLTGKHETQSMDKFSWGVMDRGASIRIPLNTSKTWKGYLEDRRPASNADPYLIGAKIINTLNKVK